MLARQLAADYGAELAPEFVREFALALGRDIRVEDTDEIARGQIALEDEHISRATRLLIQDTDLLSTTVYSDHYYNYCSPWIRQAARDRRPGLYLLMDIDVPWVPDGVRDREKNREEIQRLFNDAVAASDTPYVAISGSWEHRTKLAHSAIDAAIDGAIASL
ncbi:MAG: ATP-binding protein [Gemmatimonadaceae bacterium]